MMLGRVLFPNAPILAGLGQANRAAGAAGGPSPVLKHQNLLVPHQAGTNWQSLPAEGNAGALCMGRRLLHSGSHLQSRNAKLP